MTISIDPNNIPSSCPGLDEWIIEFPSGTSNSEYLYLGEDGLNFSLEVLDATMTTGDYTVEISISHIYNSSVSHLIQDYVIQVTPCALTNIEIDQ